MTILQFDPCVDLESVENGKWDCSNYNLKGSECRIKCNPGFKYSSTTERVKICNKSWNDKTISDGECEPISCPAIEEPQNGMVRKNN